MSLKLGIKWKVPLPGTRAGEDGNTIIEAMLCSWDVLQGHLSTLDEQS